jgi:outer membrane receptor protein involved in Fe transport
MKLKFITIFMLLFSFSALAQSNDSSIKGRVLDPNQAPIAGAKVTAQRIVGNVSVQTQTDSNGEYEFKNLVGGDYKIIVEASGFSYASREVTIGNQQTLDIELSIGNLSETVTVTATRTQLSTEETAVPTSVVGRDQIERKAVNTLGDVFRTLPGTSTVNEGAFQVRPRIRGLDSNRVLILVDGERLNNSRTSTGQSGIEIGLVETSQVETLEVVRGSGSVLYGTDALAGTINIITRDTPARRESGFRFGGTLDTFYSSNEKGRRGNLAVNGSSKNFAFRVSQSLDRFQNYFTGDLNGRRIDGVTADGEVLNSQSHGGNTQAVGRVFLNDTNTLRLNYERRRAANVGSASLVGAFNAFFPFSDRDKFSGRYDTVNLTENFSRLSISGFYQKQKRNFTNIVTVSPVPPFFPGFYQFSETVTDTATGGFDVQTDWALGSRNNLTAGVSFFRDNNSDNRLVITSTTAASVNRTTSTTKSVPDASLSSLAGFAQDEFRINKRLKFVGGVRLDSFNTQAEPTTGFAIPSTFTQSQIEDLGLTGLTSGLSVRSTSLTGDFGVVFNATQNIILSSRIGRSFRSPNIFERFFTDFGSTTGFVVGNPNLKPETGINFDASAKFRTSKFAASVTYFNNYFKDFLSNQLALDRNGAAISIPRPPLAPIPVFQTKNIGKVRIQGVEAEFEAPVKVGVGYFTPYGNFSYLRGDNLQTNAPLDFISPVRTNAGIRWQNIASNYFADYNVRIVNKQSRLTAAFRNTNLGDEPGFVSHNLNGGYTFRRENFNFKLNVGISNLFNRFYSEQFVFAPARGRSFTIGTSWEIK